MFILQKVKFVKNRFAIRGLLFCLLLLSSAMVEAASVRLSPEMEALKNRASSALFNLKYEEAKKLFEEMIRSDPKHPAGYIYLANAIWLDHLASIRRLHTSVYNRNDSFFFQTDDPVDPKINKQFRATVEKGVLAAEEVLKTDPYDVQSLYYLGMAKNLIGSFEGTVKRSFYSALRSGSKGVGLHRKVLALDPGFVDAELSVGMYNYVVGSLPFMVKVLAFLGGVRGSKKEGLRQLEKVAEKGTYVKDEAAVLLVVLYEREKKYEESLGVLRRQSEKYPENFIYRLQMAYSLGRLDRTDESLHIYRSLLENHAAYEYMPDLIHYHYAEALLENGQWEEAYRNYSSVFRTPRASYNMVTMAHLGAGKSLDALGKREQATTEYNAVLKRQEIFDSQDLARRYLKKPYRSENHDNKIS